MKDNSELLVRFPSLASAVSAYRDAWFLRYSGAGRKATEKLVEHSLAAAWFHLNMLPSQADAQVIRREKIKLALFAKVRNAAKRASEGK